MKTVTRNTILSWQPCYTDEELNKLLGRKKTFSVDWLLKLNISDKDKVWALCHNEWWDNPERTLRLIACDIAESVLHIFENEFPSDNRPRLAIQAGRDYANGLISVEELDAASSASYVSSASHTASCAAGLTVSHAVSHAASYAASYTAIYTASYTASYAASYDASYVVILDIFKKYIGNEK